MEILVAGADVDNPRYVFYVDRQDSRYAIEHAGDYKIDQFYYETVYNLLMAGF